MSTNSSRRHCTASCIAATNGAQGLAKPAAFKTFCPASPMTRSTNLPARSRSLALLQHGDRVGVDGLGGLGERHRRHLVACAERIGDIHQPGVGLAAGHFVEHVGHLRLFAYRVRVAHRSPFRPSASADPHGTCGAHTTTDRPGRDRSLNEATFFGLPGAVTIVSVLDAKFTGSPASRSACAALSMFLVSAEAKTSAGRALRQLGHQIGGAGEGELDVAARVVGLELLSDLGERLLQRRSREDDELPAAGIARRVGAQATHPANRIRRPRGRVQRSPLRRALRASRLSSRGFHDHGGGFDDGHGNTSWLQLQLARRVGAHQRYDGERAALASRPAPSRHR